MGALGFDIDASLKTTTDIHVFVNFNCAANFGGWPPY